MTRAQLQYPLNWILVIVGGAFFLLLFISIATFITDSGEEQQETTTFTKVLRIIENTQASPGTTIRTDINMLSTCENSYAITVGEQQRLVPQHTIFSPPQLQGSTTIWSETLRVGTPLTTLTYLLPDAQPLYAVASVDVNIRNYLGATTITDITNLPLNAILVTDNEIGPGITVVLVDNSLQSGRVKYYSDTIFTGESAYPNKELLTAAVVSTSASRYDCGLKKAEDRMHFLARLNDARVRELRESESNQNCEQAYLRASSALQTLAVAQINDLAVRDAIVQIERANQVLLGNSCPPI